MWRYVVGGVGALLLAGVAIVVVSGRGPLPTSMPALSAAPIAPLAGLPQEAGDLAVPEATAKTREQKRFGRYDKDKNGAITRAEYLASRRKAYAKLDTNGDGTLSFDEWATKTLTKFATADANHDGAMTPAEFVVTAPKRSAKPKPKCLCPAPAADPPRDDEG
ncbi:MAG: EF-hand domain-containing protein [Sphingomonas sp.]